MKYSYHLVIPPKPEEPETLTEPEQHATVESLLRLLTEGKGHE
jgi:hypothetical protein